MQAETSELISMADYTQWWEKVDPRRLNENTRYRLPQYAVDRYGQKRVYKGIDVSRITMWRLLEGSLL